MFLRKFTPSMPQLLAFEAAARHGSFTAAAGELCLTQSAVSRHIQELEGALKANLFVRNGRRVTLTPAGLRYANEIAGALSRIRRASMDVYDSDSQVGVLQLAVLPIFGSKWLMPRLSDFHDQHPEVLVNVHSRTGNVELPFEEIDAYITLGDGHWPNLASHHIMAAEAVVIASPGLQARMPLRQLTDLLQHPLLRVTNSGPGWHECLLANGMDPRQAKPGSRFEYTAHLIQAVSAGMGLGLVTRLFVEEELRAGTLVALELPDFIVPTKHYYLLHQPETQKLPTIQVFTTWLLARARAEQQR